MAEDRDREFFRGYAAAVNDLERRLRAGVEAAGQPVVVAWIADQRDAFGLPEDGLDPEVGVLMARLHAEADRDEEAERMRETLGGRVPREAVVELLQMARRAGRAMPEGEDGGD